MQFFVNRYLLQRPTNKKYFKPCQILWVKYMTHIIWVSIKLSASDMGFRYIWESGHLWPKFISNKTKSHFILLLNDINMQWNSIATYKMIMQVTFEAVNALRWSWEFVYSLYRVDYAGQEFQMALEYKLVLWSCDNILEVLLELSIFVHSCMIMVRFF